ncbi:MAG: hypothetical protein JOZ99_01915 [Actinobacteria bacterium]|nr:hypothetical protein [Actinomycetota bacterium]
MDGDGPTAPAPTPARVMALDLLEEIRAAVDLSAPSLRGRVVDIEMARLRVVAEPAELRRALGELITSAAERAEAGESVGVRVARTGASARVDVRPEDRAGVVRDDAAAGSITLPLAAGSSNAADA